MTLNTRDHFGLTPLYGPSDVKIKIGTTIYLVWRLGGVFREGCSVPGSGEDPKWPLFAIGLPLCGGPRPLFRVHGGQLWLC